MFGMLGLATDVGRMFIYKNELQTFADASALAAITKIDGSQAGVANAQSVATAGPLGTTRPNGCNFDTIAITNVTSLYGTALGTYDPYSVASSNATNTYKFVRVTASSNLPLNFLPVLPGIPLQMTVSASAVAGQQALSSVANTGKIVPFAPDAHNQADTANFGFTPGVEYSLKWDKNSTTCAGDAGFTPPGAPPSEHGFVDIGEGNSNSNVRNGIT